jgi:hypothetical protein
LEFSFGGGEPKKDSFGTWGNTWDFNGTDAKADAKSKKDKKEDKKEETPLGDNNPWSFGNSAAKKKKAGFDFGDLGASNNDFNFDGDLGGTKSTDDAWGFAGKKDKKKAAEEKKEDSFALDSKTNETSTWDTWGTAGKKDKKKSSFLDDTTSEKKSDSLDLGGDTGFDWGFGGKDKSKKKNLISALDVPEPPKETAKAAEDDDWMKGAWGASSKKSSKKTTAAALDPAPDPPPATTSDDIWGSFGKSSKKTTKAIPEEDIIVETAATPEMEEDLDWALGLSSKDKKKKEKELRGKFLRAKRFSTPWSRSNPLIGFLTSRTSFHPSERQR